MIQTGVLYVVATPIGNLGDLTSRSAKILEDVDLIVAEDTRHTAKLLNHLGLHKKMLSLHDHNESQQIEQILSLLQAGQSLALVSDAGTPLISDPGFPLVRAIHDHGLRLVPIPGPSAAIAALSVSGIASDRFTFEGFLPAKRQQRLEKLKELAFESRTMIFYESVHRIVKMLEDCCEIFGIDREVTLARELTKQYETIKRATLGALCQGVAADESTLKGEYVLVVSGYDTRKEATDSLEEVQVTLDLATLIKTLLKTLSLKETVKIASNLSGRAKNEVYTYALGLVSGGASEEGNI